MKKLDLLIVGAGQRGQAYAQYALEHPERAVVRAVAEPREFQRQQMARQYGISSDHLFGDWKEPASKKRMADAVVIATQDKMHTDPAVAFADMGYDVLLEKPMAPTEAECRKIVESAERNGIMFAVAHVLRYTKYTRKLKEIVDSGRIGEVISIQHLEPVGYWHQAHSYVRGSWRNEAESTFMLMAKSCHDLDWIRYFAGASCAKVSSFGNLKHFKPENKPAGAAKRCLDCAVESACPYSAPKIYLGMYHAGQHNWPVSYITTDISEEGILAALRDGPYGRCVYDCDNDVVDHQVVNMEFANGVTASFTMTAFTKMTHRQTMIFGTHGQIKGDGERIEIYDFRTDQTEVIEVNSQAADLTGGHGGGDMGLMQSFVDAVSSRDKSKILSGPTETLETHLMVFAAEKSRREGTVVCL